MSCLKTLRLKGNPLNLTPDELAALVKLSSMSSVKDVAYTSSLRLQQAKKKRTGVVKDVRENLVFGVVPQKMLEIDTELTGSLGAIPRFFQRAIVHILTTGMHSLTLTHSLTLSLTHSLSLSLCVCGVALACSYRFRGSIPNRWRKEPHARTD
jgi:hypothetical protein